MSHRPTSFATGKRASIDDSSQISKRSRQACSSVVAVPGSWRTPEEQATVGVLVSSLTTQLVLVCEFNAGLAVDAKHCPDLSVQVFYGTFIQPFPLVTYVQRLADHMRCSQSAFIASMVYLRRIQAKQPALRLTDYTVHRLFITALLLATKYLEDEVYENSYYARVGGVELADLNAMEIKMLHELDFDLSVSLETFRAFEEGIMESFEDVADVASTCSDSSEE